MPEHIIIISMGGLFIILGIVAFFWGRHEEKGYYDSLSTTRTDLREFMEHQPSRPEPSALKIGGWITITVGLLMLAVGIVLWF